MEGFDKNKKHLENGMTKERAMADIVHEAQDTHLCALFIGAHGDTGDYEYALDAANSAAKHLQAIQAELPATSPLARDAGMLAKFVRAAQRNLSQQRPADKVLLQSWAESRDDPVSHFLMAAACRRSQAVSKTRLTITASGLGCP
ncbi:hypothetical protein [Corynebacterium tuberculostearicum]|uniref:hypothetical protein n=1 Tax=Corynebacterium tuberculostearicum TaxID=38304 RepID=UPI0017DD8C4B|nr:hypothetical protein [Corynebacterium tuberculostearicum]NYI56571.1 hypothetical protein [Corynebacterium tuberculostearicum]